MSTKETAIELIRNLPDDASWADIVAAGTSRFGDVDVPGKAVPADQAEAAWAATINRRAEEILTGQVQGIPAEEVLRRDRRRRA